MTSRRACLVACSSSVVLGACASVAPPPDLKAPEIQLSDLSIQRFDLAEMVFDLKLDMLNGNAVSMPLSDLKADLQILGLAVASARAPQAFTIPAGGRTAVPLQLSVPFGKITEAMRALRAPNAQDQLYSLAGSVAWGPLKLPLRFERKGNLRELLGRFLPGSR
jgi:LEA14-like dessication related protein